MKLSDALRSPKYQVLILIVLLIFYLLSPNDFFRVVFGILTALTFLAMVALEMKSGVDQQGWKNEIKDTAVLIIVVLLFWFAIQFILNTPSPISAVVTCSMLPNLQRGDFAIVQGAIPNAHEIELTKAELQQLFGKSTLTFNGTDTDVSGSAYSYCLGIGAGSPLCAAFVTNPESIKETRGPLEFKYSKCLLDKKVKGGGNGGGVGSGGAIVQYEEPCVSEVVLIKSGKSFKPNYNNDVIVYQPAKYEYYSLSGDIIHRAYFKIKVSETGEFYFLSKGDNNPVLDIQVFDYYIGMGNEPISKQKLKGKLIAKVPLLGYYKLLLSGFFTEPSQCATQLEQK